jgi:hypothetical protein
MRSRLTDTLRVVLVALAIGALTACIIGPKQDDPASGAPAYVSDASADTGPIENFDDTGTSTGTPDAGDKQTDDGAPETTVPMADTGCVSDADAGCGDAAIDAPIDAVSDAPEGG